MREPELCNLLIREISAADASAIAGLNEELGYPESAGVIRQRIEALSQLADHVIYVACLSKCVVGWIAVREGHYLQGEPRAEINGLVVSGNVRSQGIGRRLIERAGEWALKRGLRSVVVRSRITREGAHRFYLREGFERTKTSEVFTKNLIAGRKDSAEEG